MRKKISALRFFHWKRLLLVLAIFAIFSSAVLPKTFSYEGSLLKLKTAIAQAQDPKPPADPAKDQAAKDAAENKKKQEAVDAAEKKKKQEAVDAAEKKKKEDEAAKASVPKETGTSCNNASLISINGLICGVMGVVQWFLGLIIKLLSLIIFILIEILLAFAKYNGFATARPVEMGWKIVRDICNMFFIVIILISAFSTILQYDSNFHYSKVLPKLLLMAILINFSRTLIQLLVDFSQVIMLTFVNAFYQAGAGNFVQALGLTQYLQTADSTAGGAGTVAATQLNVLISYMLAIILLIISIGILAIFIAYIIARIVGLWIALIFSPIALMETAIPARLQKGMSAFTEKYWKRLGTMLSGGPIIAFFLWLTLATVQETAGSGAFAQSLGLFGDKGNAAGGLSQIANSQGIASFVIAVAMMLMGLDAAMEAAEGMGSKMLSGFAQEVKKRTEGAVRFAGRQFAKPITVPATGVKNLAVAGGLAAGGGLAGLGIKAIRAGQNSKNVWGRMAGTLGAAALASPLVKMKKLQKENTKKKLEEKEKDLKDLSYDEKLMMANKNIIGAISGKAGNLLYSDAEKQKQANLFADLGSEKNQIDQTKKKAKAYEDQLKVDRADDLKSGKISESEIKGMANERAMREVGAVSAGHLATAIDGYKALGMTDKAGDLEKLQKTNPSLIADEKKRKAFIDKENLDPKWKEGLTADALSRGSVMAHISDAFQKDGVNGDFIGVDAVKKRAFMEKYEGSPLGNNMSVLFNYVDSQGRVSAKEMEGLIIQKDVQTGNSTLYNSSGRVRSKKEADAVERFDKVMGGGAPAKGDFGSEFRDSAVKDTIISSLDYVSVGEQMGMAGQRGSEYREAVAGAYGSKIQEELSSLNGKANADGRVPEKDLKGAMNYSINIISQMPKAGMGSQEQMKIIAGFSDQIGTITHPENRNRLGKRNERFIQQMLSAGSEIMGDIDKKIAKLGIDSLTELEKEVKKTMDSAQENIRRVKGDGEEAAPAAWRKAVYSE